MRGGERGVGMDGTERESRGGKGGGGDVRVRRGGGGGRDRVTGGPGLHHSEGDLGFHSFRVKNTELRSDKGSRANPPARKGVRCKPRLKRGDTPVTPG